MTVFENVLVCILIPITLVLMYIAGKHDMLGLFCEILEEKARQLKERNMEESMRKFRVITLCGSTRFKDAFLREQKRLTLEGNIVISVGLFGHSGDNEVWADDGKTKIMLDDMHKKKIDMSDGIFVINEDGYIGESTKREIEYAIKHDKTVEFLHPIPVVERE